MSNFEEKILFAERHFDEKGNIFMDKFVETNNPDCKFIWYKYKNSKKEMFYSCNHEKEFYKFVEDNYGKKIDKEVAMTKTKEFKFRLTEKEFEEMRELAEQEGRTMSNLLRYLVAKERKEMGEREK